MKRGAMSVGGFAVLVLMSGCQVSVRTTEADTVQDLQAEDRYKAVYAGHMSRFQKDLRLLAPSGSSPGVCNAGGLKQGCYEADAKLIEDLKAMLTALAGVEVPPRYAEADELLKDAIAKNIRALELRNQAIAENDDAPFQEHKVVLEEAVALYQEAYELFPEDNRPQPPP